MTRREDTHTRTESDAADFERAHADRNDDRPSASDLAGLEDGTRHAQDMEPGELLAAVVALQESVGFVSAPWFCELHRLTTTTDCPKCDAEQIADLEHDADTPACSGCGRTLVEGESAWASDWHVIEPDGVRVETRYTCDDCSAVTA